MIFECCLIFELLGSFTIESILAKLDLTVRVVPGITSVTVDPILAIDLSVISPAKVHLVAIVTLLVVLKAIIAPLTELDLLARVQLCLEEASADVGRRRLLLCGWQLDSPGGSLIALGCKILLFGVVRATKLVIAVVFLRCGGAGSSTLALSRLPLLISLF